MKIYGHHMGKETGDFTMRDMRKLIFKFLDLCCEFYKMYTKLKCFRVQEKTVCTSRTDEFVVGKESQKS